MEGLLNELIPDPHVRQTEGLQIGDHTLSTSCGVVGQPDHHCGHHRHLIIFIEFLHNLGQRYDEIDKCCYCTWSINSRLKPHGQSSIR